MDPIEEKAIVTLACTPGQEIAGTSRIVTALGYSQNSTHYVCRKLRRIRALHITRGRRGRGHKTVYRLNRNSSGQPRRK